jgi:L-ascorbate metabolism protein UlaG (beta-lactamase superfamily)
MSQWTSPNFKNGSFQNQSPTETLSKDASFLKVFLRFLRKPKFVNPPKVLPSVKTDLLHLVADNPVIVWFGHSSYLIHHNGLNILVDPVFSGHASPVSFMVKAFPGADAFKVSDLPPIDILIITHNHYDHLDKKTLAQLKPKAVYTALGVSGDLPFASSLITEMDWWDTASNGDVKLTATPARHFSGRGLKRGGSLWASFVLELPGFKIYVGGDSGYDSHFKTIGEKFGPFDIVILETGQYNPDWPMIHMSPEEAVQAALELKGKVLLPVHWGKFSLALHPWDEPVIRAVAGARDKVKITTPRIGEPVILNVSYPADHWWEL